MSRAARDARRMSRGQDDRRRVRRGPTALLGRGIVTIATACIALLSAREARAFCRSTACDPATEKCTTDDNGCPRTGPPLSWRALPLPYRFHKGGSDKLDMDGVREA